MIFARRRWQGRTFRTNSARASFAGAAALAVALLVAIAPVQAYVEAPVSVRVGTQLDQLMFSVFPDCATDTCTISPALPASLVFDTMTGTITSGTLYYPWSETETVSGETQGILAVYQITFYPYIELDGSPQTALAGDTMTAIVPHVYGFAPSEYMLTTTPTELFTGLNFDTGTGVTSGQPFSLGAETLTVTAMDPNYVVSAQASLTVVCPPLIRVDTRTAAICLPNKEPMSLQQGADPVGETATEVPPTSDLSSMNNPHFSFGSQPDGCVACHRTHADKQPTFVQQNSVSRSQQCMNCHDGLGASGTVHDAYFPGGIPYVNDSATRSYFTHDALATFTNHASPEVDEDGASFAANEFAGVSNRHSDCVDCHNPHIVDSSTSQQLIDSATGLAAGWSLSGAHRSVSVVRNRVDTSSAFVGYSSSSNFEYELCLKCHSSFTQLPSNSGFPLSQHYLDKAADITPPDADSSTSWSAHPIVAPGTNSTETMTASLSGSSKNKLWVFRVSDTVRCTNCHADRASAGPAGQTLGAHASPNRGILILPYRDRELISAADAPGFVESRTALCFACHTDVPFANNTSSGSAFMYHFEHGSMGAGTNSETSTSIDVPGAGNHAALCSECHFRLHSTRFRLDGQILDSQSVMGTRLVNFAPNVQQVDTATPISWSPRGPSQFGTCTLKCHGVVHRGTAY